MKIIKIWNDDPSRQQVEDICRCLEEGNVIVWPTDTIYALACDALNSKAVEQVCRLKGLNPDKNNLSIVCNDISQASEYARIGNKAFSLMKQLTPGPYTFLFRSSSSLPKVFKGRKTVGIRIPDCNTDRMIVERLGRPVMTSSILFEDEDYAINPDLILETYNNKVEMLVDAGTGDIEPSTIIDCTEDTPGVLRQGKGETGELS